MSIKEALVRQNMSDKIMIGNVVDKAMRSKFGDVFYAIIEGLKKRRVQESSVRPQEMSSDRVLGRIEGYDEVVDALELSVLEMKGLTESNEEEENAS